MQTIDNSFNFKRNNFSFLRFFFATSILYFHAYILGGFGVDPLSKLPVLNEGIGKLAVFGFFIISGFLVTKSLLNSPNIFKYGVKRFLRIFPAFWVNLIITSFGFAAILYLIKYDNLRVFVNFHPNNPIKYVITNSSTLMHQYNITNLLENNPYKYVFNGSLWTLFLEVKAYILLGIIGIFGLTNKKRYLVLLVFLILWTLVLFNISVKDPPNKYTRLIMDQSFLTYAIYFFAGSVFYLFKELIPFNNKVFYFSVALLMILSLLGILNQFLPILFTYIIIWLANNLPFQNFDKHGDFSYGIYLYAFPIQQLITYFNLNHDIYSYIIICFSFTFIFAVASWHLIEKPFIDLKKILAKK